MQAKSMMNLSRLQSFSDSIFAFAATLLVIEFKVPDLHHASVAQVAAALLHLWRPLLAYTTSFIVIGVTWINHHPIFAGLDAVNRTTTVLNLMLMIVVAFLPFPTELIADYGAEQPLCVAFYGLSQAACGFAFVALSFYVAERYRKDTLGNVTARAVRVTRIFAMAYPLASLAGAALAFAVPTLSILIYVLLPVVYLLPNAIEYQLTSG